MTIKQLKDQLDNYPDNATVNISYTLGCGGNCNPGGRCYCPSEEREAEITSVFPKEPVTIGNPNPVVKTVLINFDLERY